MRQPRHSWAWMSTRTGLGWEAWERLLGKRSSSKDDLTASLYLIERAPTSECRKTVNE